MRGYRKWSVLYLLTLLFLEFWTNWSYSAELPELKILRVPPGWVTTEGSYVANEEAMRTIYSAIWAYREERDIWERAYYEMARSAEEHSATFEERLSELRRQFDSERAAWQGEIHKTRKPGFGVFGGVAYASSGSVEAVVGAGVVWRIF